MNFFRNVILPIAGIGYEWHLHKLSSELSKQQHAEATIQHNESEQNAQMLSSAELITSTLSTKLETYRDACEEKLKKYSNYLLMTSIIIGVLGQILPFILPEHNKYILNTHIPLIDIYYFFLTNTFGCLIICFIDCIVILNDISYFMTNLNHLWSNIETICITKLNKNTLTKFNEIQDILSDTYYILCNTTQITNLDDWFNYNCKLLHYTIICSALFGFISFILSFIISLEAILIPIKIIGSNHSYNSFVIVITIISIEIISLFIFIFIHNYKKNTFEWYSSKSGQKTNFSIPITICIH